MNGRCDNDPNLKTPSEFSESGRSGHILLIDHDIAMQAALTVLLELNFRVETASSALEAFRCLNVAIPALVVLDPALPDSDGTNFLHSLRESAPACPVIVMTTSDQEQSLRDMGAPRIAAFCWKPVNVGKLLGQVDALLNLRTEPLRLAAPHHHYSCEAITYIYQHYRQPLTVKTIAGAIGVSSSHLSRLFRSAIGISVRDYLTKMRLEITRRLLTTTDDTLDRIAEIAGFYDASHVSRVFRHHMGCWPGEYRRRRHGLRIIAF